MIKTKKEKFQAKVFGKVNLCLYVTGIKNNLHTLDSVMASVNVYDKVTFYPSNEQLSFEIIPKISGVEIPRFEKTLVSACKKIMENSGLFGGKFVVEKGVPLGAGMGGSTASVVAILKTVLAYFEWLKKPLTLSSDFLVNLGSDVPFMMQGGVKRVLGVGEQVQDLDFANVNKNFYVLALYAKNGVDTKECYALYDKMNGTNYDRVSEYNLSDVLDAPKNSLFPCSKQLNPEIVTNIERLKKIGCSKCVMSGSGSLVFSIENILSTAKRQQKKLGNSLNSQVFKIKITK